jgi:hypothetical protein
MALGWLGSPKSKPLVLLPKAGFFIKALLGAGAAPNYTKSKLRIYTSIMKTQTITCVSVADLFSGAESLIPQLESGLFYEYFYLGGDKFVTLETVVSFVEDETEGELSQLVLDRAKQVSQAVVKF